MARVTDAPTHFACARYTKLTSIFIGDSKPANRYSGKVKRAICDFPAGRRKPAEETQTMPPKAAAPKRMVHALHQVEGGEKVAEVCRL